MKFTTKYNKQNKTAPYSYLPAKLSKIYKLITDLLSSSNGMMVLVLLLVVDFGKKW